MLSNTIEKLLVYATFHLGLKEEDVIYTRNILLTKLHQQAPYHGEINVSAIKGLRIPDVLVDELRQGLIEENVCEAEEVERLIVDVFGVLTPLPSVINHVFTNIKKDSAIKATNYLYDLQVANNYIQKTLVDQNIQWKAKFKQNDLDITINLSKPEKDNKQIAKLKTQPALTEKYPNCVLCEENVGYAGRSDHPARGNLRTINLNLAGEHWFFQYSPYVYYDKHCIVIDGQHTDMVIDQRTLSKLFAFVDIFPHFFIGSNSDLPIVGGSILNHEHFQGGAHIMPLMKEKAAFPLKINDFRINGSYLDWYNSAILLKSYSKKALLDAAVKIVNHWKDYSDKKRDIIAHTNGQNHNTVTPIVRKKGSIYHMYIILRNNRCDETHPDGIFHAHREFHHIKKEGIGLIEAMGLFILPARLVRQMAAIKAIHAGELDQEEALKLHPDLADWHHVIDEVVALDPEADVENFLKGHINNVCRSILENTGVFKNGPDGHEGFKAFMKGVKL